MVIRQRGFLLGTRQEAPALTIQEEERADGDDRTDDVENREPGHVSPIAMVAADAGPTVTTSSVPRLVENACQPHG